MKSGSKNDLLKGLNISWLVQPDLNADILGGFLPRTETLQKIQLPIAAEIGSGFFETLEIADMAVFRAVHHFNESVNLPWTPLGEFRAKFQEPTLFAHMLNHGRVRHQEHLPEKELIHTPDKGLFRYSRELWVETFADPARSFEMYGLRIGQAHLSRLIGDELSSQLLVALGFERSGDVQTVTIPHAISLVLHACPSGDLEGKLLLLHAQAKVMEYLVLLCRNFNLNQKPVVRETQQRRSMLVQFHREFSQLNGKLPNLEDLAKEYGTTSRTLNEDFKREYGQSIYAYLTTCRLREAYAALLESDIPIKVLAHRMGHTHVSNFIATFKKQFGCTPGSLRKRDMT